METWIEFLREYRYIALFFGMVVGGETVLIPSVYLLLTGFFEFIPMALVSFMATALSDSFWYLVGRLSSRFQWAEGILKTKYSDTIERLRNVFDKHGLRILFYSKFVYGTRIAAQVLCGVMRISYVRYIIVNSIGIAVLFLVIVAVGSFVGEKFDNFFSARWRFQIFLLIFSLIMFSINVCLHVIFKKKIFQ